MSHLAFAMAGHDMILYKFTEVIFSLVKNEIFFFYLCGCELDHLWTAFIFSIFSVQFNKNHFTFTT